MSEIIIGRNQEQKELEDAYSSKEAEFIAIYGRRRIGKTFLIRNFFYPKKNIYFQATGIKNSPVKKQLERFAQEIGTAFYKGTSIKVPNDWMHGLEVLTQAIQQQPKNKKIVLFFDELPWLATPKSGLIQAIEYFWNRHWAHDSRIKLIVCGSSASWIIKKIIKNHAGLHNRVTIKIRLRPFTLYETSLLLKHLGLTCSPQQVLKIYMSVGGVPFYLKQFRKTQSIDQNINNLFFNANGLLFDEFDEVFSSLFDHSEQYQELVTLIASYKDGILRNELEKKNKLTGKGGRLTKRLEDLEIAGFINSYIPFGRKKRGNLYKISDEYCYFYLTWLEPIKSQLKHESNTNYWIMCINKPKYYTWLGYAFENICYKHISSIKLSLGLDHASLASPWRYIPIKKNNEYGAQIDLLFDRNDDAITICEIKYSDKLFVLDKKYAKNLINKKQVFIKKSRTKKQIFIAMIVVKGLKNNLYSEDLISDVVTLNDLLK